MLDELVITAAVGTARKPPALPAGNAALEEAFATLSGASPESKLLGAVAILSRYESAGRLPAPAPATIEPAADETLPLCSRRAAELLSQVLTMTNTPSKEQLAVEWLSACSRRDQRVPHRLLPALLDYGASHPNARKSIADVCGARGAWLMRLSPRWRYDVGQADDPSSIWSTGTKDQRLAAIGRLRRVNPASARDLIGSTWKEDAAEDRVAFVGVMLHGLGPEDEVFLESSLDDRSKQVRAAAADLLARLPSSAYVRRMVERAKPLMKLVPATRTGLLRKLAPASLQVTLPPEIFDPSWARDGIIEKPAEKIGRRQWYLQQFLSAIPPGHWSSVWKLNPEQCIDAANGEFADVVLSAWHQAALRHPNPEWNAALLRAAAKEGRGPLTLELLSDLPDELRQVVISEIILSPRTTIETVSALLRAGRFSLNADAAAALTRQIENESWSKSSVAYPYLLTHVLAEMALRLPPEMYDELAERWTGERWTQVRKALDEFFATLLIRRNIQREFNP